MSGPRTYTWSNRGFRWSMLSLLGLTVVAMFVGFIWLPAVHPDFESDGLWASICRAAGVPYRWGGAGQADRAHLNERGAGPPDGTRRNDRGCRTGRNRCRIAQHCALHLLPRRSGLEAWRTLAGGNAESISRHSVEGFRVRRAA